MFRRLLSRHNKTRLPSGTRIYVVGDIHGRADLLEQITHRIDQHFASNPIGRAIEVYLGDYIDRGPASRQVIEQLIQRSSEHEAVFLKGNHEAFLIEFLKSPRMLEVWGKNGGLQTLASYGVAPPTQADANKQVATALKTAMPKSHRAFLKQLKSSFICGKYFFVHAGVRPGIALAKQDERDLFWIREEFLTYEQDFSKIIVHGHTPVNEPDVRPNRINVDTGAYATGRLTCALLERNEVKFI